MLTVDLGGNFSTGSSAGDHALLIAQTWSERLAKELPVAIAAREQLVRDDRDLERMDDWSPTKHDVARSFRQCGRRMPQWSGRGARRSGGSSGSRASSASRCR